MLKIKVLIGLSFMFSSVEAESGVFKCRRYLNASEVWILTAGEDYILMNAPYVTVPNFKNRVTRVGKVSTEFLHKQIQYLQQFYSSEQSPLNEVYQVFTDHWQNPIFLAGVAAGLSFSLIGMCISLIMTCVWMDLDPFTNYMSSIMTKVKLKIRSMIFISSRIGPTRRPLFNDSVISTPHDQMSTGMLRLS